MTTVELILQRQLLHGSYETEWELMFVLAIERAGELGKPGTWEGIPDDTNKKAMLYPQLLVQANT